MKLIFSLFALTALMSTNAVALDIAALESAMANPDRPAEDKARDATRRAPQVLDFMGVEPGMRVLDINASAGWYTEVLSYAVGSGGTVLMQNAPGGRSEEAATARANRLSNVEQIGAITDAGANSVDFAFTGLNFHDFHNSDPSRAQAILADVMTVLESGGILGIVDHEGTSGADNESMHRIAFDELVKAVTGAGFALVGVSDVLDNPTDDHTLAQFDQSLERNTDRMVLKFIKL